MLLIFIMPECIFLPSRKDLKEKKGQRYLEVLSIHCARDHRESLLNVT